MKLGATAPQVLVLAYHRIGDAPPGPWNDWFYVPEERFAQHLRLLRERAWSVIDLRQLFAGLENPTAAPARSALITFDDGDRTLLTGGLPHLLRWRAPAVVFVATDFIGGTNAFDAGHQPPERICSWEELRELADHGVSIQAHSLSHPRFTDLAAPDIRRQLRCCKQLLEDRLGHHVEAFAYPFGDAGRDPARTEQLLEELGYRAAFLYGGRCPWPLADSRRFHLARLPIGRDTELDIELAGAEDRHV